jgi:hypothetical protein
VYRRLIKSGWTLAVALLLNGCILFDDSPRSGPDEFGVVSRAPLSQPPDYQLRPPRAGAKRPNEATPRAEARAKLLGKNTRPRGLLPNGQAPVEDARSTGELALLTRAGAVGVDPEIRTLVDRETGRVRETESLVDTLVFWRTRSSESDVIDPKRERERLNRDAALGEPSTEGNAALNPR